MREEKSTYRYNNKMNKIFVIFFILFHISTHNIFVDALPDIIRIGKFIFFIIYAKRKKKITRISLIFN